MTLLGGSESPQNLPICSDDVDPPSWIVSESWLEYLSDVSLTDLNYLYNLAIVIYLQI